MSTERLIRREKHVLNKNLISTVKKCYQQIPISCREMKKMNVYLTDINHRLCSLPPPIFFPHSCKT